MPSPIPPEVKARYEKLRRLASDTGASDQEVKGATARMRKLEEEYPGIDRVEEPPKPPDPRAGFASAGGFSELFKSAMYAGTEWLKQELDAKLAQQQARQQTTLDKIEVAEAERLNKGIIAVTLHLPATLDLDEMDNLSDAQKVCLVDRLYQDFKEIIQEEE